MKTNVRLQGRTYAGDLHVRFDEGDVASAKPRCRSRLDAFNMRGALVLALLVAASANAESWHWLGTKTCNAYYGKSNLSGYALKSQDNWKSVETGQNGVPKSGDIAIINSSCGEFGSDFDASVALGGLTYEVAPKWWTSNQGTPTFQAGGPGIVVPNALTMSGDGKQFGSDVVFTGSGDMLIDIKNGSSELHFGKSITAGDGVTLVKDGWGVLKHINQTPPVKDGVYQEARDVTAANTYYPFRKFDVRHLKIKLGAVDVSQYYWVRNCEIRFAGNSSAGLNLRRFADVNNVDLGVHSFELQGCKISEDEGTTNHRIYGDEARCYMHMFGEMSDSVFSGNLAGAAGLVWEPANAATFTFKKTISNTTGILTVKNGTVAIADGAGFSNLPVLTVDGAGARFEVKVAAQASLSSTKLAIANGGKVVLGQGLSVKGLSVDGMDRAEGIYCGAAGAVKGLAVGVTVVDWIEGVGHLIVGSLPVEAATVAKDWKGSGWISDPQNNSWVGGKPKLDDGSVLVNVITGAGGMQASQVNGWFKGFSAVAPDYFKISAAAGKTLAIGSAGITCGSTGGTLDLGGSYTGTLVAMCDQTWDIGSKTVNINDPIATLGSSAVTIQGSGSNVVNLNKATPGWTGPVTITDTLANFAATGALGPNGNPVTLNKFPTFAGGIAIDRDLRLDDGGFITCEAGTDLTFNGEVTALAGKEIHVRAESGSTITFNKLYMTRGSGPLLRGTGTIVFNDSLHCHNRLSIVDNPTIELHKGRNRMSGDMGRFQGGKIKTMVPYAITKANTIRITGESDDDGAQNTHLNLKESFVLDLQGNDQSVDQLAMHADGNAIGGHVYSEDPATMHVQTEKSYWSQYDYGYGFNEDWKTFGKTDGYAYETSDKGRWEGRVTLSYEATPGMIRSMMRTSTSSGAVEVVSGTLVFLRRAKTTGETFDLKGGSANPYWRLADEDGAWPNAEKAVVKGGVLKLEHGHAFGKQAEFDLSSSGTLELCDGVRQRCAALRVDGVRLPDGTYGSEESSAEHKMACMSGRGILTAGPVGLAVIIR